MSDNFGETGKEALEIAERAFDKVHSDVLEGLSFANEGLMDIHRAIHGNMSGNQQKEVFGQNKEGISR
jgi:hypothetical protein